MGPFSIYSAENIVKRRSSSPTTAGAGDHRAPPLAGAETAQAPAPTAERLTHSFSLCVP